MEEIKKLMTMLLKRVSVAILANVLRILMRNIRNVKRITLDGF